MCLCEWMTRPVQCEWEALLCGSPVTLHGSWQKPCHGFIPTCQWTSPVQTVKRLPAVRETRVQSLGQEDFPQKEMAPHSSTLAWKIPWMEEPGRPQSMGSQRVGHDWATSLSFFLSLSRRWRGINSILKNNPATSAVSCLAGSPLQRNQR